MRQLTEILNNTHQKKSFTCGKELLDNYLKRQAKQDIKRKLSVCFILNDNNSNKIQGYYTLSNNSIDLDLIPASLKKHLQKSYTSIPTTLLGRLAVDNKYKKQGLGKLLLVDALKRSFELSKVSGSFAVVTVPLDENAEKFYLKYGFIKLPDSGKMFLPMKTVKLLFDK